jgi:hypothetical protein
MSGTSKWVYITNNPSSASKWVYITNDPSKGESVHITNNPSNAEEWVYITNNPSSGDWIYVTNPDNLPSDVGAYTPSGGNNASGCGCVLVLVILCFFFFYGAYVTSDFFSSISPSLINTSTNTPSPNTTRVEKTLTPTPILGISQRCPMWKTVRKDLAGSRFDIWAQHVSKQPNAMEWAEFKEKSLICNPVLIEDGYVFIKGKEYLLP